jgi:putative DNA primase/helicase
MISPVNEDGIRAALTFIPAEDRELWLRIGMALKSELGESGFDMFETWSHTAENFDAKAVKSTWKSFKAGGGITIATLIAEAKQYGFDPKRYVPAAPLSAAELERQKQERMERERHDAAEAATKQEDAAREAANIWGAASETGESPYLIRKAISGLGTRFAGDTLLVPLRDADSKLWNVQRIFADGDKRFLAGGRVSGCFHVVGELGSSPWLLIAEGYATAATLHLATSYTVAVAFNAGNIKHVARTLRHLHPTKKILICADDDHETENKTGKNPGLIAAQEAASASGSIWCKPSDLPGGSTDFNDMATTKGLETVRAQIMLVTAAVIDSPVGPSAGLTAEPDRAADLDVPKRKPKNRNQVDGEATGAPASRPYFKVDERGVWYHGFSQQGDPLPPQWICSPLHVTAKSRDAANGDWGYLLEFEDADGKPKRWVMPASMLAGDGTQYRATLLAMGLQIGAGVQAKNQLTVYIQTRQTDLRVRCTDRVGWHDDVYVLPDRTIGEGDEMVMFQSPGGIVSQFKQRGTLDEWRNKVATLCRGNSRMVFCVSAAFAAPLLYHSGVPSGGFHIWGDSSSGKSTAFKVAGSVYGGKDYPRNWRMTVGAR